MNHLFIRSDATPAMGTGHVMRCLALAQAWKKRGGTVTFITHCPSPSILKRIGSEGFCLIQMEEICPSAQDIQKTLKIIQGKQSPLSQDSEGYKWVVLDGYHFTSDYQKAIMESGFKLLVIDDYNHLDHYNTDILLNQNIGAHHFNYSCLPGTEKLLGTKFVMLRSEFLSAKKTRTLPQKAKSILVTMGGSDPDNITLQILQAVNQIDDPELNFRIIAGPGNPHITTLKAAIQSNGHTHLIDHADMPELMGWADLCITAGGSTCWELCFFGVPFLVLIIAENQLNTALGLAHAGAAINLGKKESLIPHEINHCILATVNDIKTRQGLKKSGVNLVDGKGTKRIIRQMLVGKMMMRPAGFRDAELLFKWANDKEVRSFSFNADPISWEEHLEWFSHKLKDKNSWVFIAENNIGEPIGQIRFEGRDGCVKISYSLDKRFRGLGLGKNLLELGLQTIRTKLQNPCLMQGFIKKDNIASKMSFEKAGFTSIKNQAPENGSDHIAYQLELSSLASQEKP
ncbi:MAG: UDP-2,4-diacetamido-2,4,6-trideoxy-beta-L-altropyranose hydrolase [Desulfobacula sp.]|nr:UDP-2,4-diacetamido-2,4,6-trideoxy-beta-L-altropyranose hydrolase [Desulfobacula sp.]